MIMLDGKAAEEYRRDCEETERESAESQNPTSTSNMTVPVTVYHLTKLLDEHNDRIRLLQENTQLKAEYEAADKHNDHLAREVAAQTHAREAAQKHAGSLMGKLQKVESLLKALADEFEQNKVAAKRYPAFRRARRYLLGKVIKETADDAGE